MTQFSVVLKITGDASGGLQATVLQTRAIDDLRRALEQEATAAKSTAVAERQLAQTQRDAAAAARQHQFAVRNLGFQISDIGTGLASGQSPFIILAQQSGQVAQALSGMQGAAGVAGRFLAGPFGAFVVSAVSVLGALFLATRDAEQASNSHTDALEEQEKAIKELQAASEKALVTEKDRITSNLRVAQSARADALETRRQLDARLALIRAEIEGRRLQTFGTNDTREIGTQAYLSQARALEALTEQNQARIETLNKAIRSGQSQIIAARIEELEKSNVAAEVAYRNDLKRIEGLAQANKISLDDEARQRLAAQRKYSESLKQAQADQDRQAPARAPRRLADSGSVREKASEQAADLRFVDQLTAKYQPLVYLEQQRAEALERIKEAQARGAISQSAAAEFAVNINRDADQAKLKLLGDEAFRLIDAAGLAGEAAGDAATSTIEKAVSASGTAADQFLRIWDTARERVQGSLADTIDDLLSGKAGSISDFWKSFAAIGRRSIAETLAALVFSPQQGVTIPGIAGGGVNAGGSGATGVLSQLFNSSGSPFGALTRGIEDLTSALGFGGGSSLGQAGVNALDALGLAGGGGAGGGIGGGLLSGLLGGGGGGGLLSGLLGGGGSLLGSALPFVGAGLSVLDIAGVNVGKIFAPVEKFIGGAFSGAATGASIGSIVPGIGTLIGGAIGGLVGGITSLFQPTKKSSSTLTIGEDGGLNLNTTGTSSARRKTAETIANGLFRSLEALAGQLQTDLVSGVSVGSIGTRKDKFVFDPTGRGRTRGDGVLKFDTAEAAQSAALFEALKKGAVELSEYGQRVVQTANDLNEATQKLQTVRAIEDLLGDPLTQPLSRQLQEFDATARAQLRVAREAGFNLVEVERKQGEARAKVIREYSDQATQSLQSALDQLQFGSASPLSAREQLDSRLGTFQTTLTAARGGDQAKIDEAAQLGVEISTLAQQVFATGPEFARIYAEISSALEDLKARTADSLARIDQPQAAQDSALVAVNAEGFADVVQELRTLQGSVNALAGAVNGQASTVRLNSVRDAYAGLRGLAPA